MFINIYSCFFGEPSSPTGSVYINCGRGEGRIVHTELDGHDMTPSSASDLMGEGLQPLTGGLERAKVPLPSY